MQSFKKYKPEDLRELATRMDDANEAIETQRYNLQVKKTKLTRQMKDRLGVMREILPKDMLEDHYKEKLDTNRELAIVPSGYNAAAHKAIAAPQEAIAAPQVQKAIAGPSDDTEEQASTSVTDITEQYDEDTKDGTAIKKFKEANQNAERVSDIMEALAIDEIRAVKDEDDRYVLKITGEPYGDDMIIRENVNKMVAETIVSILKSESTALRRDGKIVPVLQHITNLAKAAAPSAFPIIVTIQSAKKALNVLLTHPNDTYGARTAPKSRVGYTIDYINWIPATQVGTGLGHKSFTLSDTGKFGKAMIDPIELKLNSQLIAYVDGKEVLNEKVSAGLKNLFTSKIIGKHVKKIDMIRFMELLDVFDFRITPHIKKTAKFVKLVTETTTEESEPDAGDLGDVNRNIEAMQAGNKSASLVRDTFDMLDGLVEQKKITQDRKEELLTRIVALVQL